MATYLDLFKRTARSAGFDSTTAAFSDGSDNTALVKELLNESNKVNAALTPMRPKTGQISAVSGTAKYELPSDFNLMRYVYFYIGTRKIEITNIGESSFLKLESLVTQSQYFVHYTIRKDEDSVTGTEKNYLWIFPVPGTT